MRYILKQLVFTAALVGLALALGLLVLLTFRAKRSSRLYRLRIMVLGAIVALLGGGVGGCSESTGRPDGSWTECYAAPWDPGLEVPPPADKDEDAIAGEDEEAREDEDVVWSECYVPNDPGIEEGAERGDGEETSEAVEGGEEGGAESDDGIEVEGEGTEDEDEDEPEEEAD